jgi:PilZ domain
MLDLLLDAQSYRPRRESQSAQRMKNCPKSKIVRAFSIMPAHTFPMRTPTKHFEREVRRARRLSAWIVLAGQANQECQVMDISKNGAKLVVGTSSQAPEKFELAFTETATKRQACEVIWRRGKMIGVQFV